MLFLFISLFVVVQNLPLLESWRMAWWWTANKKTSITSKNFEWYQLQKSFMLWLLTSGSSLDLPLMLELQIILSASGVLFLKFRWGAQSFVICQYSSFFGEKNWSLMLTKLGKDTRWIQTDCKVYFGLSLEQHLCICRVKNILRYSIHFDQCV